MSTKESILHNMESLYRTAKNDTNDNNTNSRPDTVGKDLKWRKRPMRR